MFDKAQALGVSVQRCSEDHVMQVGPDTHSSSNKGICCPHGPHMFECMTVQIIYLSLSVGVLKCTSVCWCICAMC